MPKHAHFCTNLLGHQLPLIAKTTEARINRGVIEAQVVVDSQHLVDNWGDGAASWWYYVPWHLLSLAAGLGLP